MSSKAPDSFGARLYALLLHLYPKSFRREYGESMLQLFNDQSRAVHGTGGYAMLWLKMLRDLVLSVPAAHSNDASRKPSRGAAFVWTVVVILVLVFLVNGMILPSMISRMPNDAVTAVVEAPGVGPTGEYRAIAQVTAGVVSTLLAFGAFLLAVRQRSMLTGAATFVAGWALTFMALATLPWLWLPLDRYPAGIVWALGIWPLAAIAWAVLTLARRRNQEPGPA